MYTMYKCQNTWTYFFFFFYLFDHFVITVFDCVKQLQRIGNLQYDVAGVKCKNIFFAQIFAPIFYKILIRVKFNLPLPIILNYFYLFFSFLSAQNILVVKENLISFSIDTYVLAHEKNLKKFRNFISFMIIFY